MPPGPVAAPPDRAGGTMMEPSAIGRWHARRRRPRRSAKGPRKNKAERRRRLHPRCCGKCEWTSGSSHRSSESRTARL
jgi:hypothetical protein